MASDKNFTSAVECATEYGADVTVAMIEAGMSPSAAVRLGALAGSFAVIIGDKIDDMSPKEFLAEFMQWVKR